MCLAEDPGLHAVWKMVGSHWRFLRRKWIRLHGRNGCFRVIHLGELEARGYMC